MNDFPKKKVGIIVVNYNTREYLMKLVDSIKRHLSSGFLCCIVDNNSNDGSREYIKKLGHPFSCQLNPENIGYGRACNGAAKNSFKYNAEIEHLCFLNSDIEFLDDPFPRLKNISETDPKIAVIGPKLVNAENKIVGAGVIGTNVKPYVRHFMEKDQGKASEFILDVVSVCGAFYFVRKDLFFELGGFLETFFYYEETYFSYLTRHRGYRVVYTGTAKARHYLSKAPKNMLSPDIVRISRDMFRARCGEEKILCD